MGQGERLSGGRCPFAAADRSRGEGTPDNGEGPWVPGSLPWVDLGRIGSGPFHMSPGSLSKTDSWAQAKSC